MTLHLFIAALAGLGAGVLHFATLAPIARMLTRGQLIAVALQAARLVAAGLVLWLLARGGAATLLAGTAGLTAGRAIALRRRSAQ
ncbi:N-ATPase subunit AtpR [Xylophilus sp.]|uniref:N-ATPase subunit AtpR n=1 Tax=Xylophilus sp. TaxID=2653893 RepID=UPI0013BBD6DA|nr:ATP synthase subunit I [Xylophilus sp.]KAF1045286.1 MAG: hypothetical protein GAK38_03124 [Xylophilus sp.]